MFVPHCIRILSYFPSSQTGLCHPVVFLSGVTHQQLTAVLDLVYLGTTDLATHHLPAFLEMVERFSIGTSHHCQYAEYAENAV